MEYKPSSRPTDIDELRFELIRNAAFVAHEGQKARELARWREDGDAREVIYVFDTDVIKTYCAPWISGPADELGQGYGQVLPLRPLQDYAVDQRHSVLFEERRRAESVAWLLASKALQSNADRQIPILQTTPHSEETLRVYRRVKADAQVEANVSRLSSDEREGHDFRKSLSIVSAAVKIGGSQPINGNVGYYLSNILNTIQDRDLQRTSRFVREWDGFMNLFRQYGGIFELSEFRSKMGTINSKAKDAWNLVADELAGKDERKLQAIANFDEVFQKIVMPEELLRRREQRAIDSLALAEVAYVNQRLSKVAPDSFRVVFITGDKKLALFLATAKASLGGGYGGSIKEFAFNHVFHLWSFVDLIVAGSVPSQVSTEPTSGRLNFSRSQLFSGLLAFEQDEDVEQGYVDHLAEYAIKSEPSLKRKILGNDIDAAYQKWDEFSKGAASFHRHFLLDSDKREQISRILVEKLNFENQRFNIDEDRLYDLAVETMERARDRSNVEFSEIGANSILDAHRHGIRNPPDLMFDSLKVTGRFFKDLALPKRIFVNAEDFAERFKRIADDCYQPDGKNQFDDDDRQECYLKYLVLGALFASANRWIVAEEHAENAVKIVARARALNDPIRTRDAPGGQTSTNMSGREAYYLLAVVNRVRASSMRHYELASEWIQKARACLQEDRDKNTALGIPFIRFDSEVLAISLGRYYYMRSQKPDDPCNYLADQVLESASSLLGVRQTMKRNTDDTAIAGGDKLGNLPASTRTNIAINLVQVAVIAGFRNNMGYVGAMESPVNDFELKCALDAIVENTDLLSELSRIMGHDVPEFAPDNPEIICSPLIMLYSVVGASLAKDNRIWKPSTKEDVDCLFARQARDITHYDAWRFKMLRKFSKSLLS